MSKSGIVRRTSQASPAVKLCKQCLRGWHCAFHEMLWRHPNDAVVIVGHDSVNRVLLLHALDLPLSRYWHLKQDPCALSELDFINGTFTVRTVNETWHLNELPNRSMREWTYNFCLIHRSLRVTAAMAAGITDTIWSLSDLPT